MHAALSHVMRNQTEKARIEAPGFRLFYQNQRLR